MENQKLENLLNLALSVPEDMRARSQELEIGYHKEDQTWELIVKYSGSLEPLREMGILTEEMHNEYAVLTVPEGMIETVSRLPQIEYVEKPKRLFFSMNQAKGAACINAVQEAPWRLTGRGVLVAVLDSGLDYYHEAFRDSSGKTRLAALWDQNLNQVFSREEIDQAIQEGSREKARRLVPSFDASGHGTAVAGIAAGSGLGDPGRAYRGIAYESELLVVKLGNPKNEGFPRTTELMRAVNFAVTQAVDRKMPLVINISFGNTYGSHEGNSLLETYLDDISNYGKTAIIVGSGNEGASAGHTSGIFLPDLGRKTRLRVDSRQNAELSVAPYESGVNIQLWKNYWDEMEISLLTPSGEEIGPLLQQLGASRFRYRNMEVLVYYGEPSPYSQAQEIYFDFVPDAGTYVESGIWTFRLTPGRIITGEYDFWLPSSGILNPSTRFLRPTPDTTLTIPSAAASVITVGAYDSASNSYADFSGRGFTRRTNQVKPDIAAPGVGIMTAAAGGGYEPVTGTSFAAPFVSGSAALMMQWGIVDGRDPFLYGEKIKAYLRQGARKLPGMKEYPNPQVGYGALCVRDSLPQYK